MSEWCSAHGRGECQATVPIDHYGGGALAADRCLHRGGWRQCAQGISQLQLIISPSGPCWSEL
eukprot:564403-Amphidinium_carterae.1